MDFLQQHPYLTVGILLLVVALAYCVLKIMKRGQYLSLSLWRKSKNEWGLGLNSTATATPALSPEGESAQVIERAPSIRGCRDFFPQSTNYLEMLIFAMTGQQFLEEIKHSKIYVRSIRIIAPSQQAVKEYFNTKNIANKESAIKSVEDTIMANEARRYMGELVQRIALKRINAFPLSFYAVFLQGSSPPLAMTGVYTDSSLREHTIGLESHAWIDSNSTSIQEKISQFDAIWNSL